MRGASRPNDAKLERRSRRFWGDPTPTSAGEEPISAKAAATSPDPTGNRKPGPAAIGGAK